MTKMFPTPDLRDAACVGTDPELWFAQEREEPGSSYQLPTSTVNLIGICYNCPVHLRCLQWILRVRESPHFTGVYAGLRPADRALLWKWRHDPGKHAELLAALIERNRPLPPGRDPDGNRFRRPPLPPWAR